MLRRVEEKIPCPRHQNVGAPTYGFREHPERNQNVDNPRPRAPQFQNPNVLVIDEINDEFLKDEDQFLDPQKSIMKHLLEFLNPWRWMMIQCHFQKETW
jgi:hypothetical protein